MKPRLIVAFGSSFAAGPGIEPIEDAAAMRSSRNYPHLLADRLGARLVDLTVSGATTETVLESSQTTLTGATYRPQIEGLPADADLVTITVGGNDLQLGGSMMAAAWRAYDPNSPVTAILEEAVGDGIPSPTARDIRRTADGLKRIVAEVGRRAPGARVILVDYLSPLGDRTVPGRDVPFPARELAGLRRIQAAVREAHVMAADNSGAELLAVSTLSDTHALGDPEPWVFGFAPELDRTAASFHPNLAGMDAIATALTSLVG